TRPPASRPRAACWRRCGPAEARQRRALGATAVGVACGPTSPGTAPMNRFRFAWALACLFPLAGCGGTKLLRHTSELPPLIQPLASASDGNVAARLDFVIVRNGPGAWAKNGDWDEYLLRLAPRGDTPVRIVGIELEDARGVQVLPLRERKALVRASRQAAGRYRDAGIRIEAGRGGGALLTAGVGAGVLGYGAVSAAATSAALGAGGTAGGGAAAAAGGLLLAAPVLLGVGVARLVNNGRVDKRIRERATPLPVALPASGELPLDLFFPITPGPKTLTVRYEDAAGEHALVLDTVPSLRSLHLVKPAPDAARAR
ncbi:MAG TPA: hypothetical protein VL251_01780, partial [Thermomonas sp.]|nr:hypothetical protein [Thermomonas sp.]